jgi:hypothetical protein
METSVKIINEVRERRAARAASRQLRAELATYATPREIVELLSAVTRSGVGHNDQVRLILERNLVERQRGASLGS